LNNDNIGEICDGKNGKKKVDFSLFGLVFESKFDDVLKEKEFLVREVNQLSKKLGETVKGCDEALKESAFLRDKVRLQVSNNKILLTKVNKLEEKLKGSKQSREKLTKENEKLEKRNNFGGGLTRYLPEKRRISVRFKGSSLILNLQVRKGIWDWKTTQTLNMSIDSLLKG
jgi:hypothetical protein